ARILSGFGWAGATVSAVVAMALLLPPGLQATGQALTATTSAGIGGMVSGLAGGLLYQNAGPTVFFLAGAALAFGGLLLGWAVLPGRGRVRLAATGASSRRPAPSADTTGSGATPAAATMTAEPRLEDG
ncbi:MAG TPA: hypothetical protein VEY67_10410, partial [Candidatus Dormibacteraeota bacterium]|nr:hypothetical protein [Candidatus Dormibacteraeota bacterium]